MNKLEDYEVIDLYKKYPNNFPNVTLAFIYRRGNNVVLTIDSGKPIENRLLYKLPDELKNIMPSFMIFSVFSDTAKNSLPVYLDPRTLSIRTYNYEFNFCSALYGQICWTF